MPVHVNPRDTIPIRPTTNQVLFPQNTARVKGIDKWCHIWYHNVALFKVN